MASVSHDLTVFHLVAAGGTNATLIAAAPTDPARPGVRLYWYYFYNNTASMRKIAFHDTATTPTAGSGVKFSICLPPNSAANVSLEDPVLFAAGLAITIVTGIADSDATGVTASDVSAEIGYR